MKSATSDVIEALVSARRGVGLILDAVERNNEICDLNELFCRLENDLAAAQVSLRQTAIATSGLLALTYDAIHNSLAAITALVSALHYSSYTNNELLKDRRLMQLAEFIDHATSTVRALDNMN